MGFEPKNPYGIATSGDKRSIDWSAYRDYLQRQYRPMTVRCRYGYALKYHRPLLDQDFSPLNQVTDDMRVHILKSLSILSKYLGINDRFRLLMQKPGFKVEHKQQG